MNFTERDPGEAGSLGTETAFFHDERSQRIVAEKRTTKFSFGAVPCPEAIH